MTKKEYDTTPKGKKTTRVREHVRVANGKTILVKSHIRRTISGMFGKVKEQKLYDTLSDIGVNEVILVSKSRSFDNTLTVLTDKEEAHYFGNEDVAKEFAQKLLAEEIYHLDAEGIRESVIEDLSEGYASKKDWGNELLCEEFAEMIIDKYGYEKIFERDPEIFTDRFSAGKHIYQSNGDGTFLWYGE